MDSKGGIIAAAIVGAAAGALAAALLVPKTGKENRQAIMDGFKTLNHKLEDVISQNKLLQSKVKDEEEKK